MKKSNEKSDEENGKPRLKIKKRYGQMFVQMEEEIRTSRRTNSVASGKKKFVEQLQTVENQLTKSNGFKTTREELAKRSQELEAIFILQFQESLRISEVLGIKLKDILDQGKILIRISKGGEETIISAGMAYEYIENCRLKQMEPFSTFNYQFIYREWKKLGLAIKVKGNKNEAVTHRFRYIATENAKKAGISSEAKKNQLHHKGKETHKYYEK